MSRALVAGLCVACSCVAAACAPAARPPPGEDAGVDSGPDALDAGDADDAGTDGGPLRDAGDSAGDAAVVDEVVRERSLVFTQPAIVDDDSRLGLAPLLAAISDDGHGGALLDAWFSRFATTAHSERAGPALLLEDFAQSAGADPAAWDLSALPFLVTGVHNRIDLKDDERCGELRVSLASTAPAFQPFHLIFLFAQEPLSGDRADDGTLHCQQTARRWAALSALDDDAFLTEARALLDEGLSGDRFLMAETVEFIIAPWEWRQWRLVDNPGAGPARVFDNPPLFQTVDIPAVNTPGPLRDELLAWVEDNAADIDARTAVVPESFRAPSARVNDGVPWVPLDLTGVDEQVLAARPTLRGNLEIVGCHACHATDADFVQTRPDRTFSDFYDKELDARAAWLFDLQRGHERPVAFGPLQSEPVLP